MRVLRFALLVCVSGALFADDVPPAMRDALKRMFKEHSGTPTPGPRQVILTKTPPPKDCSVPLVEMKINDPEQFKMPNMRPPAAHRSSMPTTEGPAPACQTP